MSTRPKIVVDARMVKTRGHGIGNYVLDLANAYLEESRRESLPFQLHFVLGPDRPNHGVWQSLECSRSEIPFLSRAEIFSFGAEISALAPKLFHNPSFASFWSCPTPYIQTVHDLNHLYFGSLSQKVYYNFLLKRSLRKAKQICSVSQSSLIELANWLAIEPSTIELVANAVPEPNFLPLNVEDYSRLGLENQQYFICIATNKSHKRLSFLLDAYREYRQRSEKPWPLLLTISPDELSETQNEGIVFLPKEEDERLDAWIAGAACLLFPSVYEGFGRPPIEALLRGTTTIVADIPIMHEVLVNGESDFVYFCERDNLEAWVASLLRRQRSPELLVPDSLKELLLQKWSLQNMWQAQRSVYETILADL